MFGEEIVACQPLYLAVEDEDVDNHQDEGKPCKDVELLCSRAVVAACKPGIAAIVEVVVEVGYHLGAVGVEVYAATCFGDFLSQCLVEACAYFLSAVLTHKLGMLPV